MDNFGQYQSIYSSAEQNITVKYGGMQGDFGFITAVYTGSITNVYAAAIGVITALLIASAVTVS